MPDEYLEGLIRKHRSAGVVTDTNLLLVLLIGLCDRKMIEKFKRTQKYTAKDFDLLLQLLAQVRANHYHTINSDGSEQSRQPAGGKAQGAFLWHFQRTTHRLCRRTQGLT